jgi:hypothetical protein
MKDKKMSDNIAPTTDVVKSKDDAAEVYLGNEIFAKFDGSNLTLRTETEFPQDDQLIILTPTALRLLRLYTRAVSKKILDGYYAHKSTSAGVEMK